MEGIQVHADEGGTTQTRGGVYWLILPAGCKFTFSFPIFVFLVNGMIGIYGTSPLDVTILYVIKHNT